MKDKKMVMPDECVDCGSLFDLKYNFKGVEEQEAIERVLGQFIVKEHLCGECRA
jgi:hypothetical protein